MKIKFSNLSKFLPILLLVFVGGVLIFTPLFQAQAAGDDGGLWNWFKGGMLDITSSLIKYNGINIILYWVLAFSLKLVVVGVDVAAWMVGIFLDADIYTSVFGAAAIDKGWMICRDMCNLFFVMFLLVIAFATIFRVQSYSAKALLPKFIFAIFLINFSKVIATVVIDFGQIFMFQFVDWMGSDFGGDGGAAGCLTHQAHQWANVDFKLLEIHPDIESLMGISFAVVYSVILMSTYFTLAGLLLIRVIALALIIVLSPFAFLLAVFPETRSKSSEWWRSLFNYSLLGPVFVFFVYLATEMGQELTAGYTPIAPFSALGGFDQIIIGSIKNFVVIGMLLAAVTLSKSLAGAGAGMVIGGTAGLGLMTGKMYRGARYGAGKAKGAVGYAHRTTKANVKGYRAAGDKVGEWARKIPVVRGKYLEKQAGASKDKKELIVKYEKDLEPSSNKDRKTQVDDMLKTKDPQERAAARMAHFNLLAKDRGENLSEDEIVRMGYGNEDGRVDWEKIQNNYDSVKQQGFDTGEIEKYLPKLITDETKRHEKYDKMLNSGEIDKVKLHSVSEDDEKYLKEKMKPKEWKRFTENKSQNERDAMVRNKKQLLDKKYNSQGDIIGKKENVDKLRKDIFELSGPKNKLDSLREVEVKDGKVEFTGAVNMKFASSAVGQMNADELVDQNPDFLKETAHLIGPSQISRVSRNKYTTPEQIEAIEESMVGAMETADKEGYERLDEGLKTIKSSITRPTRKKSKEEREKEKRTKKEEEEEKKKETAKQNIGYE